MFSSSDEAHDVSISWNYILLSVTYNFGLGKWAKIERNDSKPLCVMTLLVDWGVYVQWARWVSKTIRQNRMNFSDIFSWSYQVWMLTPPFFTNVSTSSVKRRKLTKKVIFNSCLKLCNFSKLFRFWLLLFHVSCFMFHDCPLAGNKRRLFEIFSVT